jgi:hypothetical protein
MQQVLDADIQLYRGNVLYIFTKSFTQQTIESVIATQSPMVGEIDYYLNISLFMEI